jgi:LAS superfamily LD-carboxypeptidase LdcB
MPTVGMTDAYRSFDEQVAVKASRGGWAAKPGTSNHGHGVAIDIPEPARSWLHRNGASYGWVNPAWAKSEKYEPWHFEYVG